jgi:CheY-like chemotaxis protein
MSAPCILVIDDNPTNLKLASDVLASEGYAILQAADAEIALTVIDSHDIDLILMDIALPEMDGLTLTRLLKSREKQKRIKIVALTAFAMMGDDAKARSAGCDGYITKPINTRTFGAQVREILSRADATTEKESA